MPTYKTPGVYVEEISVFPPSVAPVETAIPGFIGYTDFASKNGKDITLIPTPIDNLLEFEALFGGPPDNDVTVILNPQNEIQDIQQSQGYLLYKSLQMFYANGGGRCYIVSIGDYKDDTAVNFNDFTNGLVKLEKVDEVTLLVAPDAILIEKTDPTNLSLYTLQQEMLKQCAKLQDRFAVMDLKAPVPTGGTTLSFEEAVVQFRNSIGINDLKYGAAYVPHIVSSIPFFVPKRAITLENPGGTAIPFNSLTSGDQALDQLRFELETAVTTSDNLETIYDSLTTGETLEDQLNILVGVYQTAVAGFVNGTDPFTGLEPSIQALYAFISSLIQNLNVISNGNGGNISALPSKPAVNTPPSPASNTSNDFLLRYDIEQALSMGSTPSSGVLKNIDDLISLHAASAIDGTLASNYFDISTTDFQNGFGFLYPNDNDIDFTTAANFNNTFDNIANPLPSIPADLLERGNQAMDVARGVASALIRAYENIIASAQNYEETFDVSFENAFGFYKNLKVQIVNQFNSIPPSGAVVGAYARVDESRGVFKAPANVSLNAVIRPTEQISREEQEGLNVDPTAGKSINAIRPFVGKGILIWGARTLAGNDNEWRYVPVRRFFIFAEESIKKATEAFVFEPNDRNTWVKVRALIENFLTNQWRAGALAGATTDDAFFVRVGLGETMTAQDILEGRMNVEIGMAVVRPAEFIILKFSHKMQES